MVLLQIWTLLKPLWKFLKDLRRKYIIKVGILNGSIYSPVREHKCKRIWIDITPEMWIQALKPIFKNKIDKKLKEINTESIDDSWTMIINPFGDNFPEKNLRLHETFYQVCNYISNGGIFVVTGGAFFWHQNTINSDKAEQYLTHLINGTQNLEESPLFQEFGVRYTGDTFSNGVQVDKEPKIINVEQNDKDIERFGDILQGINQLKRFRSTSLDTSNYIPIIRQKNKQIFPISLVKYGKGALIHIGLYIDSETSDEFEVVIRLLEGMIKNKMQNLVR